MKHIIFTFACAALLLCACRNSKTDLAQDSTITAEMAFDGVSKYCKLNYDWSIVENEPQDSSIMYIEMGEETDSAYHVIFRSYTGAFVNFYVDKASGVTKMEEYVPALDIKSDAGTINLFDYLENKTNE